MHYVLGIDIGAVSVKAAIIGTEASRGQFRQIAGEDPFFRYVAPDPALTPKLPPILLTDYTRIKGQPLRAALELLGKVRRHIPLESLSGVQATGTGGRLLAKVMALHEANEFKAICRAVQETHPDIRTVFEMGGEKSKYILLEPDPGSGTFGIADYEASGDCAAGTGSFLDQQAKRLLFEIEDVGRITAEADKSARIAGRCSVFAKSDMIHAQQKGYTPPEILRGLCEAVARNFKSSITKGRKVEPRAAFIGGVAFNSGVVRAMEEAFDLRQGDLLLPENGCWFGALGAAFLERDAAVKSTVPSLEALERHLGSAVHDFPTAEPLDMDKVVLLRERIPPYSFEGRALPVKSFLGIDIGSVSTNLVLIDDAGDVIKEIYLRTQARPIEVVNEGLSMIRDEFGDRVAIHGVGTTGSGRELIGMLVGADMVVDEITAHKTGAGYIGEKLLGLKVDTIFEIGGQDSKYIRLQDGVVTDFAMNEACAAGTGSFLEERAEELGISIKGEFSQKAMASRAPIRLGERCTVFMEQDVNAYLQKGARLEDVVAGLAYSIGYNYINRVVLGRPVGEVVFFQGGTAYNDSVAAAFSKILDKRIIIPPFNGVMGAVGASLLVREKVGCTGEKTQFRGFSLDDVDYTLREFTCKGCTNFCSIQEFRVEEEKVYWGDKCSDRFRKRAKVNKEPVVEDLLSLRAKWMLEGYEEPSGKRPVVGIPRALYTYDRFPLWNTFFRELGYDVLLSPQTNRQIGLDGEQATVSEPCFPIKAAHGHVKYLLDEKADYVFVPNIIDSESPFQRPASFMCPWGQTLPFVVRSSPWFAPAEKRFLMPTIHFRWGPEEVKKDLLAHFREAGFPVDKKALGRAFDKGYDAQMAFYGKLREAGRRALDRLEETGELGVVLVGRPYNIYDAGINLDVAKKLRDYYGVNVIPIDFFPVDEVDISDVNDNMFWNYGRKIIAAGKIAFEKPYLHLIYITNFKCGPDSYVKHFIGKASGKPFLVLQFDAHSNDAGVMTRCEAYLDSKGVLRWWSKNKAQ